GWVVACRFVMQERRLVIAELRCFPYDRKEDVLPPNTFLSSRFVGWSERLDVVPAGGLTKRWMGRAIAIGDHLREADSAVRYWQGEPPDSIFRQLITAVYGRPLIDTPLTLRGHPRG